MRLTKVRAAKISDERRIPGFFAGGGGSAEAVSAAESGEVAGVFTICVVTRAPGPRQAVRSDRGAAGRHGATCRSDFFTGSALNGPFA